MTTIQSVQVIILALAFAIYIVRAARVARLDMRYAITWLIVVVGVLLIAIFPAAFLWIADTLGFEAGTNMLFILAIAVLAVIAFRQTAMLSKMEKRIVKLTQIVALLEHKQKGESSDDEKSA